MRKGKWVTSKKITSKRNLAVLLFNARENEDVLFGAHFSFSSSPFYALSYK